MKKSPSPDGQSTIDSARMISLVALRAGENTCYRNAHFDNVHFDKDGDAVLGFVGMEEAYADTPEVTVTFPQGSAAKDVARKLRKCAALLESENGDRITELSTGEANESDFFRLKNGSLKFLSTSLAFSFGCAAELQAAYDI